MVNNTDMEVKKLVFATGNQHKLEEVNSLLEGTNYACESMRSLGIIEDIPETGNSFKENAFQKANFIVEKLQKPCFAEDSGLEVAALNGAPGIYTARYAGLPPDNSKNIEKLLRELDGVEERSAQFKTVIALYLDKKWHYFEGVIKGNIATSIKGNGGFGYDPIFIPEGYTSTFAQLGNEVKNKISHRAIAVNKMKGFLLTIE